MITQEDMDRMFCDCLSQLMREMEGRIGRRLTADEMHDISREAFTMRPEIDAELVEMLAKRRRAMGLVRRSMRRA